MFSLFKKKTDPWEQLRADSREHLEALGTQLQDTLDKIDGTLRKTAAQVRRQGLALDMLRESQEQKLDAVHALLSDRQGNGQQELLAFAEAFIRYIEHQDGNDESLRQAENKFSAFLESQDIEIIWDLHKPFDDARHQACDTRDDSAFPEATILEVVRPGFLIHGRPTPPAMVVVNKRTSNLSILYGDES